MQRKQTNKQTKKKHRANRPRNITTNSSIKTKIAVNMNNLYIQTHSQKLLELAQVKTNKQTKKANHIRMANKYRNIFAVRKVLQSMNLFLATQLPCGYLRDQVKKYFLY